MITKQKKPALPQVRKMLGVAAAKRIERESPRRLRGFRGGRRTLAVFAASLVVSGTALAAATGWNPLSQDQFARALNHRCGAFKATNEGGTAIYRIIAYGSPELSCRAATNVIEAFWHGEGIHRGGRFTFNSFYVFKRFPGWRCQEAAGSGKCSSRDGAIAAYDALLPGEQSLARTEASRARSLVRSQGRSALLVVSSRGAGAVRLGMTAEDLQRRGLIGQLRPGCELYPRGRFAALRPPLSGFATFANGKAQGEKARLTSLDITGGAETARNIGIGSSPQEALRAYPRSRFESGTNPETETVLNTGRIRVPDASKPRFTFLLRSAGAGVVDIAVPAPLPCE
ncbi:MAG TPA: hypothetical protein VHI77_09120 [Solirubrobacterales bacterium]|jgi:hypothetical protein|nr:hypothetical protein [Solirubrobacterales bacterium]